MDFSDSPERTAPGVDPGPSGSRGRRLGLLSLGALGVVYGDIGTSPLYAMRECFAGSYVVAPTPGNVFGILSLIFWSLVLVISVKYLGLVLRADNHGEGGILALVALVVPGTTARSAGGLALLGLLGASLLYGDGMLTPAISVLSAVEGLEEYDPRWNAFTIPLTLGVLVALFSLQRHGSTRVGSLFGPVMLLWFAVIGTLGFGAIAAHPAVLSAVSPGYAIRFFLENGATGFAVLAAVFLVVTGGEAIYADLGHFGRLPIRFGWFSIALPALLLNYFGQGALLLADPKVVANPFFALAPVGAVLPLVALSTAATVIASQAVITGAFSLTHQAIQLGYLPRLAVSHTTPEEKGQIYVAPVNWMLLVCAAGVVIGFGSSSDLAAAYGMAVTINMVITTVLLCVMMWHRPHWRSAAVAVAAVLLPIDLAFFGANLVKIPHGGWFSLAVAAIAFAIMSTWTRGRATLATRLEETALPFDLFLPDLETATLPRVPGTAVFLTSDPRGTPHALLHNIKHNKVVHHHTVLLSLLTEDVPRVAYADRVSAKSLGQGFYRAVARYGFMEMPDVPALLRRLRAQGVPVDPAQASYFLGAESLIAAGGSGMGIWRERVFAFLARNAQSAARYFRLPANRVVELGARIEL